MLKKPPEPSGPGPAMLRKCLRLAMEFWTTKRIGLSEPSCYGTLAAPMSEFKFACPVCGQHMAADSSATGTRIECPTCFQEIIVPRPPASASKYILSATQPIKSRPFPPTEAPTAIPAPRKPALLRRATKGAVAVLVLAGAVLLGMYWRDQQALRRASTPPPRHVPPSPWTLDLNQISFPDRTARGRIHEMNFVCDRAILQGGTLTLRRGHSGPTDLAISVFLFARQPEDLQGQSLKIATNTAGAPRILVRWSENDQPMTQMFLRGYALRLEFGKATAAGIPGKIHLSLPDDSKSWVAGNFNAEIQAGIDPRRSRPR
jgi:hypothetical protein